MKFFLMILSILLPHIAYAEIEEYTLDKSHTALIFFIDHAKFSKTIGKFSSLDGSIKLDRENIENSKVSIIIDPKSVETPSAELDSKLQEEQFFNSKKYSTIRFESTKVEKISDTQAQVTGNIHMISAIHPVTLEVTFNNEGEFMGKQKIGFSGAGKIKRSDFGMNAYIPVVGDEVKIQFELEAVKQ